jgi:hypothetical protein
VIKLSLQNLILVSSIASAAIFMGVGGMVTFIYSLKRKNRLILLFSSMWLFTSLSLFIAAAAHFYYSTLLMRVMIIPQLIAVPCIIIFIDLSRKERVNPVKITVLFVIESILLFVTFLLPENDNFEVIAGYGVHNKGVLRIIQVVFLLYFTVQYFLWSLQTWRKSPSEYKRTAMWVLVGTIVYSIVALIFYAVGGFIKLFNSIAFLSNGVGVLITIIVVLKEPKVIYILPFTAYRILVIDTHGGTALFRYDWADIGKVEENIFSALLQSVANILDDILKKGEVREIQMDRAILLIQHNKKYPIASVLVSSKSSKSLRYALRNFNEEFISNFYRDENDFFEVSQFESAKSLVGKIFDFVPEHKKLV